MENTFTYKWEVNFGPRYGNGDTAIHTYSGSLHLLPRVGEVSKTGTLAAAAAIY